MLEPITLPDAEIFYDPNFYNAEQADDLYKKLVELPHWQHEKIKMFGKEVFQPRLTALFGLPNLEYSYSGIRMKTIDFPDFLNKVRLQVEKASQEKYNACLANFYRDGKDSMGWHADDEKELGQNPAIASVSFGAERNFQLKHKKLTLRHKIDLKHGSLLVMKGPTQHFWKHQLPKRKKIDSGRINLTFRKIYYP